MSFKKPFRAVPVRLGAEYRAREKRTRRVRRAKTVGFVLATAVASAAVFNVVLKMPGLPTEPSASRTTIQQGVYFRRCDDARAAGAAPIYAGEPGYRSKLDADGDGIACEPYRGL